MDIPITWDQYSGYGIMPGYKMPPIMFNSRELATIMVGLSFAKSQVDKHLSEDAKNVELKIKNVLPVELKDFMDSLEQRTIVDPFMHFSEYKKSGGNWYMINSAIAQQKRIIFYYRNMHKENKTQRKMDPYILVFYKDHWNTIGFSHKRGAVRNFVLDRMSDIKILDEIFKLDNDIVPERLIFRSEGISHLIIVDVDKKAFEPFLLNLPAKLINKKDLNSKFFRVQFEFDNLDFLNKWLLQFGNQVHVQEPPQLINKRKIILKEMLSEYR